MAEKVVSIDLVIKSAEAASSLKEVKTAMKDIKNAMIAAGEGSAEFNKLASAAGELKDKVDDANKAISATNPNKFQALASFAGAAAGGVSAVTGAMGLFGGESKKVQEALVKVQSAMALSQGLAALSELPKAWNAFKTAMASTAIVQKLVTAGQWLFNAALEANPIGIIIIAVTALIAGMIALKDKIKFVGEIFDFIGGIIKLVVQDIKDFLDLIGLTSFAEDDAHEKVMNNLASEQKARKSASDHKIALAKADGKETYEIQQQSLKDQIDFNNASIKEIVRHAAAVGEWTDEEKKQYAELTQSNRDSLDQIEIAQHEHDKKMADDAKAAAEKEKADKESKAKEWHQKYLDNLKKDQQDLQYSLDYQLLLVGKGSTAELELKNEKLSEEKKYLKDHYKELGMSYEQYQLRNGQIDKEIFTNKKEFNENQIKLGDELFKKQFDAQELKRNQAELDAALPYTIVKQEYQGSGYDRVLLTTYADGHTTTEAAPDADEGKRIRQKNVDGLLDLTKQSIVATQSLTDAAFASKLSKTKKGSAEEEAILRKQFTVNKALQIAMATVTGIMSVMAAYNNGMKNPIPLLGPATATIYGTLAGITALGQIAKIKSTTFDGGGSVGGDMAGGSVGGGMSAINSSSEVSQNSQPSTLLNPDGTPVNNNLRPAQPQQVFMLESQATSVHKNVNMIETQMNFH